MADSHTVSTVCGYCGVGCGMTMTVDDGRVASSTGTPDHPANRGRLCTKGATTAEMLTAPGRLTAATVDGRITGTDDAVAEAARRLSAIRDEHGADAIAVYVSGQMTLEAQYLANKLTKGFLGTNRIESNSRLCMASAGTGYKQSLGADGPPGSYDDLDHADLFLVIGSNAADCHPILFLRMMERVKRGARLVVVDPRRTATAEKADLHLAIRPGTDLALLNGLLRLIVDLGGVDDQFVAEHTTGWETMAPLLAEYPADVVAELTGLDADDLRTLARWIVDADEWTSLWTMGLNQSTHGTWHTNALIDLHLATGAICRTGSGPFSLTGQPNAMGGREMGYMGPGLPGQRSALVEADRVFAERVWGVPAGTIDSDPGGGTVDMFERMAAGEIRAAWIICTNPVASMANRQTVVDALERADLVIVQEAFDGAETTAYADVVLPAALWSETDGVMVNSERNLTLCSPAVPPPGDARPDWRLIADIARAMGFGASFDYPDAAAVFDELAAFHNPVTGWDVRGATHERLREGPVQWPAPPGCESRNPIRYRNPDGVRFPTADGRARFLPRPYLPPAEIPDADYPVLLTTGRLAHQWHTMTKTGRVAKLNKLNPSSFVQMHPDTAAEFGVEDGGRVEVVSRRGSVTVSAQIDEKITPGCCFVPMHFADAAINTVTNDAVDADSLQPEFKACAVSLTPVPVEEEPIVHALASVLGGAPAPSPAPEESAYLSGLAAGIAANPPVDDAVPVIPAAAPLSPPVRAWADGVLAGYFSRTAAAAAPAPVSGPRVTLVWASQTGTAEEFAERAVAVLTDAGFVVSARRAAQVGVDELTGTVLFAVATTGDGDPPDDAANLWSRLSAATSSDVPDLHFAVLGFGDSSYADFCGFARRLDARLAHLGATRMLDRVSCEPGDDASDWLTAVTDALTADPRPAVDWSRRNPLAVRLVENVLLTGAESAKEVRRFAFELPPGSLSYTAGDALGVLPTNSPALVDEWLAVTGLDGDLPVDAAEDTMSLRAALTDHFEIARVTRDLVGFVAAHHDDPALDALLEHREAFDEWAWGRQSVDVLAEYPVVAEVADWLTVLRPLQPRLYSISSSPARTPDSVEVTVSAVRFDCGDVRRGGVCSTYLADAPESAEVRVFVQPNRHFCPPADPDAPMIMIGPGTGVAPFRGFLHEREATGASGDNWLFFGDQHRATDFLYEEEFADLSAAGVLTRLDVAFSRDRSEKIYVQDLMIQYADDVWEWLSRGAHVYVCGDASRMARDVDDALHRIVAEQGRLSPRSADAYVAALTAEHRYVRDVY
ncbi:molybdopterin-dependent oxidoreductase [Gordonia humi]|uniref:assimilatory sulfite reductase (NADPH) n=1 Tax=Gordonia humi TaxID=686429 RepID=A0A840EWJ2_9ACTN|nr:molybdopterin-dependent oxidoreductase [Gordonia humi]MBB4135951.1 NADPH-dependent sulfite reductase flavoprotein alpha-component [Gordonia humi]